MSLFLDRNRRAGPYLEWKVRIFAAGAVLGLAGILMDEAWLRMAAIVVLAGGILLRFLPDGTADATGKYEEDDDDEDADVESPVPDDARTPDGSPGPHR